MRVNTKRQPEHPVYVLTILRPIPARVVHFQVVPSIANDGVDRYNLDLTRFVEGLNAHFAFGLGVALEHSRGGKSGHYGTLFIGLVCQGGVVTMGLGRGGA